MGYANCQNVNLLRISFLDTYASEIELTQVNGYTGIGVSIIILIIGLYMIINIKKVINNPL